MTEAPITYSEGELRDPVIPVLIVGLPGKMATLLAEGIIRSEGFELLPFSLSSARNNDTNYRVGDEEVKLIQTLSTTRDTLKDGTVAVDFTTPSSAVLNAQLFANSRIPFVMGTSGGDRQAIEAIVKHSEISAVFAPNMAASVVEVQTMLQTLAANNPGLFNGWHMTIRESHQAAKKDVSGTAIAIQRQLEALGVSLEGEIESIRDPKSQNELGIQNVDGHAYHWINMQSPDGTASIDLRTQVEGRTIYVDGTLLAIKFLRRQMQNGSRGEIFSMSDVLAGTNSQ